MPARSPGLRSALGTLRRLDRRGRARFGTKPTDLPAYSPKTNGTPALDRCTLRARLVSWTRKQRSIRRRRPSLHVGATKSATEAAAFAHDERVARPRRATKNGHCQHVLGHVREARSLPQGFRDYLLRSRAAAGEHEFGGGRRCEAATGGGKPTAPRHSPSSAWRSPSGRTGERLALLQQSLARADHDRPE